MQRRGFLASIPVFVGMGSIKLPSLRCPFDPGCPAVLDWRDGTGITRNYDIVHPITREPHPNMDVFYADANTGILRWNRRDEKGAFFFAADKGRGERVERVCEYHRWKRENGQARLMPSWYVPQANGTRRLVPDDEVGVAWCESRDAFRIVRKFA